MVYGSGSEVSYQCTCGRTLGISDKGGVCSRCGSSYITPLSLFPDTYFISDLCPFCGNPISPLQEPVKCAHCSVIHHRTCWDTNEGCTTWECPGSEDLQAGVLFTARSMEAKTAEAGKKEASSPAAEAPAVAPAETRPATSPVVPPLPPKKASEERSGLFGGRKKVEEAAAVKCFSCRKTIEKAVEKGGCPSCRTTYHLSCWIAIPSCRKCGYPEEWRKKKRMSAPPGSASRATRFSATGTAAIRSETQSKTGRMPGVKPASPTANRGLMMQVGIGVAVVAFLIILVAIAGRGGDVGSSGGTGGASQRNMPTDFAGMERRANEIYTEASALFNRRSYDPAMSKANEALTYVGRLRGLAGGNRDYAARADRLAENIEELKRRIAMAQRSMRSR